MLVCRDQGRRAGIGPNFIMPTTAHPAFDKAGHLFGMEIKKPDRPRHPPLVDVDWVGRPHRREHGGLVGSAGTTRHHRRHRRAVGLAVERASGCTWTVAWAGSSSLGPAALGTTSPCSTSRLPGVTTISADTTKYGYGLKGTSVLSYRSKALRQRRRFMTPDWVGGKVHEPGHGGSRSGGLIAATWASMVSLGRATSALRSSTPRSPLQDAVRSAGS